MVFHEGEIDCVWELPFFSDICIDLADLVTVAMICVFLTGGVAGGCVLLLWQRRETKPRDRSSESGNVFFAIFASVAMVGVLGAGVMTFLRGPVSSMATITKRSIAENNLIAANRMAIVMSGTQQADGGDCDGDGLIEPLPYRDAGASPKPAGGGYLPLTLGVSVMDPWSTEYGYCVWDHGSAIKDAACGGASALRLEGAPNDHHYVVAIISAGPDKIFQTDCNAYVDADADTVPDTRLLNKMAGSDDVSLGYTYAEASDLGGDLWSLKPLDPNTATINKDLEVDGGATFGGALNLMSGGLILPADPGDDSLTGPCNAANDQQLRRTTTTPPKLQICDFNGSGAWDDVGSGGTGGDIQYGMAGTATSGGGCADLGMLRRTASGQLLICQDGTNSLNGMACGNFQAGALTISNTGELYVCTE